MAALGLPHRPCRPRASLAPPAAQLPFIALADALLAGHRALHAAETDFAALLRAELGLSAPLTGKLAPA